MSKYLDMIFNEKTFEDKTKNILSKLSGKKVLIYGAGLGFEKLNEKFGITDDLTIVAVADKKFETDNTSTFHNIKTIKPDEIKTLDFDYILVTLERAKPIVGFLVEKLGIDKDKIFLTFEEEFHEEIISYNYLEKFNFKKNLERLNKKLKGKTVVLYGAGVFLEAIKKYYDLSKLNIIGISDKRFDEHEENAKFLGYKVYSREELKDLNPDYILVSTKFYISIIEDMYYNTFRNSKIKIKPLVRKSFFTLLKEIWG